VPKILLSILDIKLNFLSQHQLPLVFNIIFETVQGFNLAGNHFFPAASVYLNAPNNYWVVLILFIIILINVLTKRFNVFVYYILIYTYFFPVFATVEHIVPFFII
jgi:hypothetical protein